MRAREDVHDDDERVVNDHPAVAYLCHEQGVSCNGTCTTSDVTAGHTLWLSHISTMRPSMSPEGYIRPSQYSIYDDMHTRTSEETGRDVSRARASAALFFNERDNPT